MAITLQQIEDGRTEAGGWKRKQLEAWGVPWPPPKGWKHALVSDAPIDFPTFLCRECKQAKSRSQFPKTARRHGDPGLPCKRCLRKIRKTKPVTSRQSRPQQKSDPRKIEFADAMRRNMTRAEKHLWKILAKLGLFLPQEVLFGYIADFCCHRHKLVVEVDGSSHDDRKEYDKMRDWNLQQKHYRTIRFTNEQVLTDRTHVLGAILEAL